MLSLSRSTPHTKAARPKKTASSKPAKAAKARPDTTLPISPKARAAAESLIRSGHVKDSSVEAFVQRLIDEDIRKNAAALKRPARPSKEPEKAEIVQILGPNGRFIFPCLPSVYRRFVLECQREGLDPSQELLEIILGNLPGPRMDRVRWSARKGGRA